MAVTIKDEKAKTLTVALRPILHEELINTCNDRGMRPTDLVKHLIAEWVFEHNPKHRKAAS